MVLDRLVKGYRAGKGISERGNSLGKKQQQQHVTRAQGGGWGLMGDKAGGQAVSGFISQAQTPGLDFEWDGEG